MLVPHLKALLKAFMWGRCRPVASVASVASELPEVPEVLGPEQPESATGEDPNT